MFYTMKNNTKGKRPVLIKVISKAKVEKGKILWLGKVLLHSVQFCEHLLKAFSVSSICSAIGTQRQKIISFKKTLQS